MITIDNIIEFTGFALGLIYLYYEYKANSRMWAVSLLMTLMSMRVYYSRGLYADFAMNVYYLLMAIYGYLAWTLHLKRDKGEKKELPISAIPQRQLWGCIAVFVPVYAAIAAWLVLLTDSTVPYFDALTTALSIIATWMLARKYLEQWFVWIFVDAVCVGLYIYKGIYFYAALYAAYTAVACLGYRKWRRLMQAEQN